MTHIIKRRITPDYVHEELVRELLAATRPRTFAELFEAISDRVTARYSATVSEEMLRLRTYEKLQNLVSRCLANRRDRRYAAASGLADLHPELCPGYDALKQVLPLGPQLEALAMRVAADKGLTKPAAGSSPEGMPLVVDSKTGQRYEVQIKLKEIK